MLAMTQHPFGSPPPGKFEVSPTREQVESYKENGFLVVDRLTTDEEVAWIRKIFEFIFSPQEAKKSGAPVDRSGTLAPGEEPKLTQSFFPEIRFPELLETNFRRNARRFAAALLGVEESRLTCWGHMIRKPPGGRPALWHQDHAYWQPEFDYCALGVWLPMHDVTTEMGAMQFIPGSHKRGLLHHRQADDPKHNVLQVDAPVDFSKAVACPLKMGGATFHSSETLHYTAPNTTDTPRLAFPMEFQLHPVRREKPKVMPWVDAYRAAAGDKAPLMHIMDGKVVPA
jgi:ectoine hydroxylase-related dioxygenase (phytanoyl-CoA dioxygenase family)